MQTYQAEDSTAMLNVANNGIKACILISKV